MLVAFSYFVMAYYMTESRVMLNCFFFVFLFYMPKAGVSTLVVKTDARILSFNIV